MKKLLLSALCSLAAISLNAESFHVDFSSPAIVVNKPLEIEAKVSTGPGVHYNYYYQHSWIMHYNGASFIEVSFTNNYPEGSVASLDLTHLASMVGHIFYSPVTISLNGQVIADGFSPPDVNYRHDSFDVTSCLKTGKNILRITLGYDAICNYWIQNLAINFAD